MKEMKVQAIRDGTVIDHIPSQNTLKVVEMLARFEDFVTIGVNFPSGRMGTKGVVKISNRFLTDTEVNCIALIAPTATVNQIRDFKVVEKHQVRMPETLEGVLQCTNPKCITNHEPVVSRFTRVTEESLELRCDYCERVTAPDEIRFRAG